MRARRHLGKRSIQLLLDGDSTHSFIDSSLAYKLEYKINQVSPMTEKLDDVGNEGVKRRLMALLRRCNAMGL